MVVTNVGLGGAIAYGMAIQSDGRIIAAGGYSNTGLSDFSMVRYNTNGSLDGSFGVGGQVLTDFGGSTDVARSIAIQGDGQIVVGGWADIGVGHNVFASARYNTADGSLDSSFGSGGKVTTDINTGNPNSGPGTSIGYVAIQSDGKIALAGTSFDGTHYNFALLRYDSAGRLDTTFGTSGVATAAVGSTGGRGFAVAIQPSDGKIVVVGQSFNGSDYDFGLARFLA